MKESAVTKMSFRHFCDALESIPAERFQLSPKECPVSNVDIFSDSWLRYGERSCYLGIIDDRSAHSGQHPQKGPKCRVIQAGKETTDIPLQVCGSVVIHPEVVVLLPSNLERFR